MPRAASEDVLQLPGFPILVTVWRFNSDIRSLGRLGAVSRRVPEPGSGIAQEGLSWGRGCYSIKYQKEAKEKSKYVVLHSKICSDKNAFMSAQQLISSDL